ncbi:hypothetical protein M569_17619, partial [Genlisea aurea]
IPDDDRWIVLVSAGFAWTYLTARPGVLIGAVDAYLLAPLQAGFDALIGRRRKLRADDFLIGEKLGEGSFGIVYSGFVIPKNAGGAEVREAYGRKKSSRRSPPPATDGRRFEEKVILKRVKIGVERAVECGDFEEWFNYRMSRAAPETCAEFLGTFVPDKTDTR